MRNSRRLLALAAALAIVASACSNAASTPTPAQTPAPTQAGQSTAPQTPAPPVTKAPDVFPRNETLYTTGKQWGAPPTWNPLDPNYAMGIFGLQYESLFLYDPLKDEFQPWLAESATWTSPTEYTIKTRQGIKWADGQAFSAEDVAFTIGLAKIKVVGSNIWDYVTDAKATDANTVVVSFKDPAYQEWATWTYNSPILPKHIWEKKADENILKDLNDHGVGTGPYLNLSHNDTRQVWQKNDNWWAKSILKLDVQPKYIVDLVNGANSVALGQLLQGSIDLSNNFLPGIKSLVDGGYGITTYFPSTPYMLSGNTAWLVPNDKKAPLDDAQFRLALAYSVNTDDIVNKVYGGIVKKADATGLLPTWDKYIDAAQRDALGFKYDPAKAKQLLAAAGYKDTNNDGFVEGKDGKAISLKVICPNGWSDWMESIKVIAASAKAVGINVTPEYPDYNALVDGRNKGNFDLVLNNEVQLSNTPWTYYDYMFRMPLMSAEGKNRNFHSYENADAWKLVQQLDKTPVDKVDDMKAITKKLQEISLKDMPVIPLWYNGMWSQVSNAVWTNWPSDKGEHILPATWNGYWNMGAIKMLTVIKHPEPAK